ncbi:hypothetical protein HDU97_008318, partial [Phlyctochytrium planicorne]
MASPAQTAVIPSHLIRIDEECIGSGASGSVFKARSAVVLSGRYATETVAVKRLNSQGKLSKEAEDELKREASTLSTINHPRIVRFLGVVLDGPQWSLVLEYLPLGSLYSFYRSNPIIPPSDRVSLAMDMAAGMSFLHSLQPPLLHLDLKSLNILMYKDASGELHSKITDFGLALSRTQTMTTAAAAAGSGSQKNGTLLWMAPELHSLRATYRAPCDVFSFGVILTEIGSWLGPYTLPVEDLRYEVLHRILTVDKQIPELEFDKSTPATFVELAMECLSINPAERPSFADIVKDLEKMQNGLPAVSVQNAVVDTMTFDVSETRITEPFSGASNSISYISNPQSGKAYYSTGSTAYTPTVKQEPIPPAHLNESTPPTLELTQSTTPLFPAATPQPTITKNERAEIAMQAVEAMGRAFNKPNLETQRDRSQNQQILSNVDRQAVPLQQMTRNANMEARAANLRPGDIKSHVARGGTPVVVQLPPKEPRKGIKICRWICVGCVVYIVVGFVIAFVVLKLKKNDSPPPPYQIVNADGKCLSGLELAECNSQDENQIFTMDDERIKNKRQQACLTESSDGQFVDHDVGFQFSAQYSICQHVASNAKFQPGRIEYAGNCLSSKDMKFRKFCFSSSHSTTVSLFLAFVIVCATKTQKAILPSIHPSFLRDPLRDSLDPSQPSYIANSAAYMMASSRAASGNRINSNPSHIVKVNEQDSNLGQLVDAIAAQNEPKPKPKRNRRDDDDVPVYVSRTYTDAAGRRHIGTVRFENRAACMRQARKELICVIIFVGIIAVVASVVAWNSHKQQQEYFDGVKERNKNNTSVSTPAAVQQFQIVNADGKCLNSNSSLVDCKEQDQSQLYSITVKDRIKNTQTESCMFRVYS